RAGGVAAPDRGADVPDRRAAGRRAGVRGRLLGRAEAVRVLPESRRGGDGAKVGRVKRVFERRPAGVRLPRLPRLPTFRASPPDRRNRPKSLSRKERGKPPTRRRSARPGWVGARRLVRPPYKNHPTNTPPC